MCKKISFLENSKNIQRLESVKKYLPGMIFGDNEIISGKPRKNSAIATCNSVLVVISSETFKTY